MKRLCILSCLALIASFHIQAQDPSFWPDEVKHIPDLDVEIFNVDKSHSKLNFSIGFFGFSDVDGAFDRFGGTILYNENNPEKTSISLVVDASSVSTNSSTRDKDLKKENFFDVENHRLMKFVSKRVQKKGKKLTVTGDLTIKGVTKEISFPIEQIQKRFIDPFWSNLIIGYKGELTINRMDYNVHGGRWGEKVLSDEVKINFTILAQQPNTFKWGSGEISASINDVVDTYINQGAEAGKAKYEEVTADVEMNSFIEGLTAKRLMQKYNFKEALAYLDLAIEKYPDNPALPRDKAKVLAFLGEKQKALALYEELAKKYPMDTEAQLMVKRLK